jgi:hypothetical protein
MEFCSPRIGVSLHFEAGEGVMNSRKPKQDVENLNGWEMPELQLIEAVPSGKPAATPRPRWEAKSDLILDLGSKVPRSRLH